MKKVRYIEDDNAYPITCFLLVRDADLALIYLPLGIKEHSSMADEGSASIVIARFMGEKEGKEYYTSASLIDRHYIKISNKIENESFMKAMNILTEKKFDWVVSDIQTVFNFIQGKKIASDKEYSVVKPDIDAEVILFTDNLEKITAVCCKSCYSLRDYDLTSEPDVLPPKWWIGYPTE